MKCVVDAKELDNLRRELGEMNRDTTIALVFGSFFAVVGPLMAIYIYRGLAIGCIVGTLGVVFLLLTLFRSVPECPASTLLDDATVSNEPPELPH